MCRSMTVFAFGVLASTSISSAGQVVLSNLSSDSTPASYLDAILDFSVGGVAGSQVLTMLVSNTTSGAHTYNMQSVYFNGDDSFGLSLTQVLNDSNVDKTSKWSLHTAQGADGFGKFDFEARPVNDQTIEILAGQTFTFLFDITGTAALVDMSAFISNFSTIPPGSHPALAAAKFARHPGDDDSAFGAADTLLTIPMPAAGAMAAAGFGTIAVRRRRPD